MPGRDVLRIVERLGCVQIRQRGSHVIVRCPGGCQTVVPVHAGQDIPIEGRITAVADVYDALSSKRIYKKAFNREKSFSILSESRGKQFDPTVLDAFFRRSDEIIETQLRYADEE